MPMSRRSQATAAGVVINAPRKRETRSSNTMGKQLSNTRGLLDQGGRTLRGDFGGPVRAVPSRLDGHDDEPRELRPNGVVRGPHALSPIEEMAERVGRQVETFAQILDESLKGFTAASDASGRHDQALAVIDDMKGATDRMIAELRKDYEAERLQQVRRERVERSNSFASRATSTAASNGIDASTEGTDSPVAHLRQFQQEADLWDLFKIVLAAHPYGQEVQDRQRQHFKKKLEDLGPVHRYSPESERWERFMFESSLARERWKLKQWFEQVADHQECDIPGVVQQLERGDRRGTGLWSGGWLETREKIKSEKRLRAWPNAIESPLPQIYRSDNNQLLVSTVDPDAVTRQQRTLEKPDTYFEEAIWMVCWEMLRRGHEWSDICAWCEERKEGWRALCISGAFKYGELGTNKITWRLTCREISRSEGLSEYEKAVFALLGGSLRAVVHGCRTRDDQLYAYYRSTVLVHFDRYLERSSKLALRPAGDGTGSYVWPANDEVEQHIRQLMARPLRSSSATDEPIRPMKVIQGYLLNNQLEKMVHTMGVALADVTWREGLPSMILFPQPSSRPESESLKAEEKAALNQQTLRIVAHMSVIDRLLRPSWWEQTTRSEDDNVLVAYIQALRAAGKRDVIPLYAKWLQPGRKASILGHVLQDITDPDEQLKMLALLPEYDIKINAVLQEQLGRVLGTERTTELVPSPFCMLEKTEESVLHPGQRIILGFLDKPLTEADEVLLRCLQWFQLVKGKCSRTFNALAKALRRCLVTGNITCAVAVVNRFDVVDILKRKFTTILGRPFEPTGDLDLQLRNEQEVESFELLEHQSKPYNELCKLVHVIIALSEWRKCEEQYLKKKQSDSQLLSVLKEARESLAAQMKPILKGILFDSDTDEGLAELTEIRVMYFPEIVIAYNTTLQAGGSLLSREMLLESMELSATVAMNIGSEGNGLAQSILEAGRMRELVRSFALTSKAMLVARAEGRPWKPRKEFEAKHLGIWEIGGDRKARRGE